MTEFNFDHLSKEDTVASIPFVNLNDSIINIPKGLKGIWDAVNQRCIELDCTYGTKGVGFKEGKFTTDDTFSITLISKGVVSEESKTHYEHLPESGELNGTP